MSSFLQLGHDSDNLLQEEHLAGFSGVVLSPVNYTRSQTIGRVMSRVNVATHAVVFDPQLYNPSSSREKLTDWEYFPSGFDSTDMSDPATWLEICRGLASEAAAIGATHLCSPASIPRAFVDSYYEFASNTYLSLKEVLDGSAVEPVMTLMVSLDDIGRSTRPEVISSIVARARPKTVYLVASSGQAPRRELDDSESLRGLMLLIHYLESAGVSVHVSHSSHDQVLWRAAGASSCSTGKFFNLRRFTPARFDEPSGAGGGVLPYWFEEGLLAFLREGDLARLRRDAPHVVGLGDSLNPYAEQILHRLEEAPGTPWVALGWRQYLRWFISAGERYSTGGLGYVSEHLAAVEGHWQQLASEELHLMEEQANNGQWVRQWRIALAGFKRATSRQE